VLSLNLLLRFRRIWRVTCPRGYNDCFLRIFGLIYEWIKKRKKKTPHKYFPTDISSLPSFSSWYTFFVSATSLQQSDLDGLNINPSRMFCEVLTYKLILNRSIIFIMNFLYVCREDVEEYDEEMMRELF